MEIFVKTKYVIPKNNERVKYYLGNNFLKKKK